MRRIGAVPSTGRTAGVPASGPAAASAPRATVRRGIAAVGLAVVLVAMAFGVHAASLVASNDTLQVAPDVTPWAASPRPPSRSRASTCRSRRPADRPRRRASALARQSGKPAAERVAELVADSARPGPFAMDLYRKGDYVGEALDTWCLAAAMQTSMNIMDVGADRTQATQQRLFRLARSLDPAPDGAAEPEGWAEGLTQLGYGRYRVSVQPTIRAAVQLAAKQLRATNRPVGLMVWRGAHSWVMSGFTATADPATTSHFTVTAVRIEDVWYPRFSTIWGYSRPPDALVPVNALDQDYLPEAAAGDGPTRTAAVMVIPVT